MFFNKDFSKEKIKSFKETFGEKMSLSYFDLVEEFENCI
jgi:hypothetical protein